MNRQIAPPALITALDVDSMPAALALAGQVLPASPWVKVGLELFAAATPAVVSALAQNGAKVFLDLKFFDIPATVQAAVREATRLGAAMTTLHAMGGARMAAAALEGRERAGQDPALPRPLLVAVTVLTSMTGDDLAWLLPDAPGREAELVVRMAEHAKAWGLDGVVCSPREAAVVKAACGPAFKVVTPGIRPAAGAAGADDQRRTATPAQAVAAGSDFLVVGRPIRTAPSPMTAAQALAQEIREAARG